MTMRNKPTNQNEGGCTLLCMMSRYAFGCLTQILVCASDKIFYRSLDLDQYNETVTATKPWREITTNILS